MATRRGNQTRGNSRGNNPLLGFDPRDFEDYDDVVGGAGADEWEQVASKNKKKGKAPPASHSAAPAPAPQIQAKPVQQQQQQQQQKPRLNGGEDYYKAFQKCFVNERTGEVVLRFHKTDIVKVKSNGDIVLTTGGYFTLTTCLSMNDFLNAINVRVKYRGDVAAGNWSVQDPNGTYTYEDNVVIPAKTAADKTRGSVAYHAHMGRQSDTSSVASASTSSQPAQQRAVNYSDGGSSSAHASSSGFVSASPPVPAPAPAPQPLAQGYNPLLRAPSGTPQAYQLHTPAPATQFPPGYNPQPANLPPYLVHAAAAASKSSYASAATAAIKSLSIGSSSGQHARQAHGPHPSSLSAEHYEELLGEDDKDDEHYCVVCMEQPRDTVLVPCGHVVMCSGCTEDIMNDNKACPVCRAIIAEHFTIES